MVGRNNGGKGETGEGGAGVGGTWQDTHLMLGNLMMLASPALHMAPRAARLSGDCCSGVRQSGKSARMRVATLMSDVSTLMPAGAQNFWMTGSSE